MKERPILFSAPMVRAILEGRKTQTRRVVKFQTEPTPYPQSDGIQFVQIGGKQYWWNSQPDHPAHVTKACPYGHPGDRLWVRETWAYFGGDEYLYQQEKQCVWYRANDIGDPIPGGRWRPSIHMPRWASRILLEVTGVRVERLQDISEEDAKAEGCQVPAIIYPDEPRSSYSYVEQYRLLWEPINGPGSWEANPWVWVIEFKRVTQ